MNLNEQTMKPINVAITGLGAPGAHGIISSLNNIIERKVNLIGFDADIENAAMANQVAQSIQVPKAQSPDFIDFMLHLCEKHNIDVLIPLVTSELLLFAANKQKFASQGTRVIISPETGLQIANNKYNLFNSCQKHGIHVPEYYQVKTKDEFIEKYSYMKYHSKHSLICFKPPVGNGMRGFKVISQGAREFSYLISCKPAESVLISMQEMYDLMLNNTVFPKLLLMEYLPGAEYSIDCLVNNGNFVTAVPRLRQKTRNGISWVGETFEKTEIVDTCRKICEYLNLNGPIGFQFREDASGTPKIIECNPRVQGSICLCTAAGVNIPYLAVKLALNEPVTIPKPKWGVKMVRYLSELYV